MYSFFLYKIILNLSNTMYRHEIKIIKNDRNFLLFDKRKKILYIFLYK